MSSHTPGPWGTEDGAEVWPMEGPTSFVTLARVTGPWGNSTWYGSVEEARANGRLIAAAPELAASLRDCVEWLESVPLGEAPQRSIAAARAILKKIEGGV